MYHVLSDIAYHFSSSPLILYIYISKNRRVQAYSPWQGVGRQLNPIADLAAAARSGHACFRNIFATLCVLLSKMWMTAPLKSDLSGQCLQKLLQMCGAAADNFKAVQKTAFFLFLMGWCNFHASVYPIIPLIQQHMPFFPFSCLLLLSCFHCLFLP